MWGLILFHYEQRVSGRSKLTVMNSFPIKEKPLSGRLLKTAYELFHKENSSFQIMLQQQEGQTCPGFAARTRHSHALHEWSDFMSFKISCTVSLTRTLHSQFLGAYQECTVFNSQTFRRIKLCSVYCHLATQIFLLAYSRCNTTPKKKKKIQSRTTNSIKT